MDKGLNMAYAHDINGSFEVGQHTVVYTYSAELDVLCVTVYDAIADDDATAEYVGKAMEVITSLMFSETARKEMFNA